jgi:hypothetical protein
MNGMTYNDVMAMPTYERRYFLGLLVKKRISEEEKYEEMKEQSSTSNSKGTRKTKIGGDTLKNKFKNGEIPLT